jgi:DNA-binding LytR/AlgR family response regulator
MNCIIVGDKSGSRLLEDFAGKYSSLTHAGTFSDSALFRDQLSKQRETDLIFLDIDTTGSDILDFIGTLEFQPNVIVISSGDESALKAFDFNVVDYILKPVSYSRFCKAIDKATRYYSRREVSNTTDNEVFIKKGASLIKLKLTDIIFVEALENYIILNTREGKFTIHFTMKALENQLPAGNFIRVHRSFIVNRALIQTIKESFLELGVNDELKRIPLGNSYRDQLMNGINLISR